MNDPRSWAHLADRVVEAAVELRKSRIPGTSTYPLREVLDFEAAVDAYLDDR